MLREWNKSCNEPRILQMPSLPWAPQHNRNIWEESRSYKLTFKNSMTYILWNWEVYHGPTCLRAQRNQALPRGLIWGKRKGSRTEGMMTTERQPEDLRQGLDAEAEQSSHLWCLAPPDSAHQHQDLRWCSRVCGCHGLDCTCLNVIRWSLNLYLEISPLKR